MHYTHVIPGQTFRIKRGYISEVFENWLRVWNIELIWLKPFICLPPCRAFEFVSHSAEQKANSVEQTEEALEGESDSAALKRWTAYARRSERSRDRRERSCCLQKVAHIKRNHSSSDVILIVIIIVSLPFIIELFLTFNSIQLKKNVVIQITGANVLGFVCWTWTWTFSHCVPNLHFHWQSAHERESWERGKKKSANMKVWLEDTCQHLVSEHRLLESEKKLRKKGRIEPRMSALFTIFSPIKLINRMSALARREKERQP